MPERLLDQRVFRRSLGLALVLPLLLMAALAGALLWDVSQLLSAARWVDQTDEVIGQAHYTQSLLLDMETGVRGYLVTGSSPFLEPYTRGSSRIDAAYGRLRRLVADNPAQVRRLEELPPLVAQWRQYGSRVMSLRRQNGDYQAYARMGQGKRLMDALRASIAAFVGAEELLRTTRSRTVRTTSRRVFGSGAVLTVVLGGVLGFFTRRQLLRGAESYERSLWLIQERAEALQKSEQWLSTTLQSIGDAVIATDPRGSIVFMNGVAQALTRWTQEEAAGKDLREVFHIVNEETRAEVESPAAKVMRTGTIVGLANHTVLIAKDGTEVPLDDSGAPIADAQGNITGVVLVFRDITERKQAQVDRDRLFHENRRQRELLETIFRMAPIGIVLFDPELRYREVNAFAARMAGQQPHELIGRTLEEVAAEQSTPEMAREVVAQFRHTLETGADLDVRGWSADELKQRDSTPLFADWSLRRVEEPEVGPQGVLLTVVDVTERELQRQALQENEKELLEADRRKDEFLAMLAHELRNPLGAVNNALQVLQLSDPRHPAWQRSLQVAERQVRHQTRLVDDLLDVSRITQGKITLHPTQLDLARLVRDTTEDHRSTLEEAGLTLILEVGAEPVWVNGDPTRLSQVLGNLLQNTAKFTDIGGRVTVRVGTDADQRHAEVAVQDTGSGIEPEMLPRVFDTFAQADRTLHRSPGGLGLGLALVKGLIDLHGGSVAAASEGRGQGAEFSFRLPMEKPDAASEPALTPAAEGEASESIRVLVVEDNRDSAQSLRDVLELSGYSVAVAFSGTAGVETARQFHPDVVLCDIGLPGMDGYGVASTLRQDPKTASARLIAVSGYGQEDDQRRAREAGFDRHLTKPVNFLELRQLLDLGPKPDGA